MSTSLSTLRKTYVYARNYTIRKTECASNALKTLLPTLLKRRVSVQSTKYIVRLAKRTAVPLASVFATKLLSCTTATARCVRPTLKRMILSVRAQTTTRTMTKI